MKITIAAIGRLRPGPELILFEQYIGRLPWKVSVKELVLKKNVLGDEKKILEGELLLGALEGVEQVVAMDERGKDLTSAAFASQLRKVQDDGVGTLGFMIGGADGLSPAALARAKLHLSFGRVTWPHMMLRMMLSEQLYRAQSILSGHPYHRE